LQPASPGNIVGHDVGGPETATRASQGCRRSLTKTLAKRQAYSSATKVQELAREYTFSTWRKSEALGARDDPKGPPAAKLAWNAKFLAAAGDLRFRLPGYSFCPTVGSPVGSPEWRKVLTSERLIGGRLRGALVGRQTMPIDLGLKGTLSDRT
jgi:hypothetical protein